MGIRSCSVREDRGVEEMDSPGKKKGLSENLKHLSRKEGLTMYKRILFPTCLTQFCEHIFTYVLNMAVENHAKLWIYYGLGRQNLKEGELNEEIKKAEARVKEAYGKKLAEKGFEDYMINVSDGDVVSEITKLARNAKIDAIIMGTATQSPMAAGEDVMVGPLGQVTADTLLWSPCPVLVIPPSWVPGLTRR
jgi:nucleotide-binding universal stress UspA family protein